MNDPEFANPAPDEHDDAAHRAPDPAPDESTHDVPPPCPGGTLPPGSDSVSPPFPQEFPTLTHDFHPGDADPEITATLLPPLYPLQLDDLTGTLETQPVPRLPFPSSFNGRIAGYQLLEFIGQGGYSYVFRARQRHLGIDVALKIVRNPLDSLPLHHQLAEALSQLGRLRHPHLVTTYGTGTHENYPFLVMELIDGPTLYGFRQGAPGPDRRVLLTLLAQVARGAAYLHANGIIHRDIKPSNILIDGRGHARLTDFGLATLWPIPEDFEQRAIVGTPAFMAPEQVQGVPGLGPATDIWSLGANLYWLLTGVHPFRGNSVVDTFRAVLEEDCPTLRTHWPEAPLALDRICRRCLQRNPAHRYPGAGDLADDLDAFLGGRLTEPELPARPARWWEFWRRA